MHPLTVQVHKGQQKGISLRQSQTPNPANPSATLIAPIFDENYKCATPLCFRQVRLGGSNNAPLFIDSKLGGFRPTENGLASCRFSNGSLHSKDKKEIIEFLLNPDFEENVSVIPIVGFGGLGKTTLARLVFDNERAKEYFELKLWVCVSTNFDVGDILRKIVRECIGSLNMNELRNLLGEELVGKDYMMKMTRDHILENGFIKSLSNKQTIEETGHDYFMELLSFPLRPQTKGGRGCDPLCQAHRNHLGIYLP
ncbi:hypothetical protein CRG98_042495 [Punica granatum]|uniref:NB-ARC domain-containing protein n=1 Tax=Punica granatum TaxID=22663 RepID=A0A2I0I081_PUNGR|nr:hypothetical protein CRG98_042495 [Punica granatum]